MNRLVLIGNGFDLAHNLPTSYKDFIYWYWENRVHNFQHEISGISDDGLCRFTALNYPSVYAVAYNDNNIRGGKGKELHNYFRSGRGNIKVECTDFFDRILNSIDNKGWVDIENEYYPKFRSTLV